MSKIRGILPVVCLAGVLALCGCGSGSTDTVEEVNEEQKHSSTTFTEATIAETELYNEGGITVTATGFDAGAELGPEIAVQVTNASDVSVEVTAEDVTVNGYMMSPGLLYVAADPGTTETGEITLYNFALDENGIETVATVSLSIVLTEAETFEEIDVGDRVTVTTSAAEGFSQTVEQEGDVLYDADGIRVVSQGLKQDETWDGDLVLYVENDTDRYIGVSCENVCVNGQPEEYVLFWADLMAGTRSLDGMYLLNTEDQNLSSVTEVREISFDLLVIDQDAWEEIGRMDAVTLSFD